MRRRSPILFLALATLLLVAAAPGLAHQDHGSGPDAAPHDASPATSGAVGFWAWTTEPDGDTLEDTFEPNASGDVVVGYRDMPGRGNTTYNATVQVEAPADVTLEGNATYETGNFTGTDDAGPFHLAGRTPFALGDVEGTRTFTVNVTVYEANTTEVNSTDGNGTRNVTTWEHVEDASLEYDVTVKAPPTGPPEGPPWLLIAGAVVAAAAAGGTYVYRRRQGPIAPRRSQALQELEAEDDEEFEQQVQEERVAERKSRELRILEAKADDHRQGIERARQRLEEGELTEHQFERIKERKEGALEDVLDRIEEKKQDRD